MPTPTVYRNITARVATSVKDGGDPGFIRDTTLTGFAVRIYPTQASYIVEGRAGRGGKVIRYTLGRVGALDLDEARTQAKARIADLAAGRNPVEELRAQRAATITLGEAFDLLLAKRTLATATIRGYRQAVDALGWRDRQLAGIGEADVERMYNAKREHHSTAALTFRAFRTIWNVARAEHKTLPPCPTSVLRAVAKKWATALRKRNVIPDAVLPKWRKQVAALGREDVRDLILFLHYTGARIGEARALTVANVNVTAKSFALIATKNGRSVDLPAIKQVLAILRRRIAAVGSGPLWAFGDVRKSHATVDACEWTYHDLRRGYVTQAHRLGVDDEIARALTNHATDVHGDYVVMTPDTLRPEAQRIADQFDKIAKLRHAAA